MKTAILVSLLSASSAFVPRAAPRFGTRAFASITENVEFDTVAREWRCKWSPDDEKASLTELQKVLEEYLPTVKGIDGVKDVQRVVCGGCLDFKVVTSLEADKFGDWEGKEFSPESEFLEKLKAIKGVKQVETQTYTLMPM